MSLDPPQPGQVIRYRYLWWNEKRQGREEGSKDRPCAVVYAVENDGDKTRIYLLPITHTRPFESEDGVELLPAWKRQLGLDDDPSWVVTSELNHFIWPGADVAGSSTDDITFGFLPHRVTTRLREMIRARVERKTLRPIDRDFDPAQALEQLRQRRDKDEK